MIENRYKAPAVNWSEMKPEKIKAHLDRHIIGQERAKKILSVAVYNHYKMLDHDAKKKEEGSGENVRIEKSNILMVGPSGVGKPAIIKALADKQWFNTITVCHRRKGTGSGGQGRRFCKSRAMAERSGVKTND